MRKLCVAIDGPAGSGKSTIARLIAGEMGYIYIDTGAMYRAVALKALRKGVKAGDTSALISLAENSNIELRGLAPTADGNWQTRIFLDGEDVSDAIRDVKVTGLSSDIATIRGVREALVALQRKMAESGGIVMDGRDIGTVVLPQAEVKIFLTASLEERAKRRQKELAARNIHIGYEELLNQIKQRDKTDSEREVSPLRQAEDAVLLDTTGLSIEQVKEKILGIIREK